MKAIILAAGKATRLLPLTKDTPQSLLKIGKKTILENQIERLKKCGVGDIVVITGYLSERVEKFCEKLRIKTLFNPFYEVSGMALTLWLAKEELKDGFVFLYSDVLFDLKIIDGLLKNKGDVCLAIKKDGLREEAEKVIEEEGVIKNVSKMKGEKENGEFVGIAKFSDMGSKKLIEELHNVAKSDLNTNFITVIDNLIKKGEVVVSYDIKDASFIDIDFPENLKKARNF
jgi:choline kinase|tara:strand:+ start:121 stop:807 length:687 start_codon:yes stop_codon:yes gene_type:complete